MQINLSLEDVDQTIPRDAQVDPDTVSVDAASHNHLSVSMQSTASDVMADSALSGRQQSAAVVRVRVWDFPLRLFHWLLAIAVVTAIITGEIGGSWMGVHGKAGLFILALVAFRVVWGFIGSTHARFLSFAPTPRKVRDYVSGKWKGIGHNPLGALSVFGILVLLITQTASGLFSYDDIAYAGPLQALIDADLSARLTGLHRSLANVVLGLVVVHILAIFVYLLFKGENLIKPMITGSKDVAFEKLGRPIPKTPTRVGQVLRFSIASALAVLVVYAASGAAFDEASPVPTQTTTPATAW